MRTPSGNPRIAAEKNLTAAAGPALLQGVQRRTVERLALGVRRSIFAAIAACGRRDGRVAEGARLESVYTGNRIVGSNPTPSANAISADVRGSPINPMIAET